jgi:hypothetical protein
MASCYPTRRGGKVLNAIRFELQPTVAHPTDLGVAIWIDGDSPDT